MGFEQEIERLAFWMREARHAVAFTGAGVSTESGIPDFRSPQIGLWRMVDPLKVASLDGFRRDPRTFYDFWSWRFSALSHAQPNLTHRLLAAWEQAGILGAVITQNIDDLHARAGSHRVYELHGSYRRARCIDCSQVQNITLLTEQLARGAIPRCPLCQGLLKPDVVLFGEMLQPCFEEAQGEVQRSDLLIVLGSSLEVYPAAELVPQARQRGARVAILNRDSTAMDSLAHLLIRGELGPILVRLQQLLV